MNTEEITVKYIRGEFFEGQEVTLSINGTEVTRKVRYNKMDGLYIVYKNRKYFQYETKFED